MQDYRIKKAAVIIATRIRLTPVQAEARGHLLVKAKGKGSKDVYLPTCPLTFKIGEIIGLSDVSKINMAKLEEVGEEKTEEQPDAAEQSDNAADAAPEEQGAADEQQSEVK